MARTDLASLDPAFRPKVEALLARLTARGFQPRIAEAWRTLDEQMDHFNAGRSKVTFSFHNALGPRGEAAALAVDLNDRRFGWALSDQNAAFFKAVGAEAKALGLTWGGDFKQSGEWARYGIGWDPGHVQALPNDALSRIKSHADQVAQAIASGQLSTAFSLATRAGGIAIPPWLLISVVSLGLVSFFVLILRRRRS